LSKSKSGRVFLVGAGPGDPGLLTLKGARAIAAADVLVYDYLAAAPIVALARPGCEKIYVGKKAGAHTLAQEEIAQLLIGLAGEGKQVVRLKGGDPFVFGRGGEEADELAAAGIAFEVVPGVTSAIAAPAYAGIPLTHREHNTAFTIVTGHEDPTKPESTIDYARLADPHQTLVLLMAMGNLAAIVAKLREHGLPGDRPVAIVREGTKPAQETLVATLDTIVAQALRSGIAAPAIVVIGDVVRLRERIRWFDTNPLFGKRVLITRPAHQAAEFAARLWEIGAEPLVVPTIAIGPPDDPSPVRRAIEDVRLYDWIVFTSQNGVDAFFREVARGGGDARAFGETSVGAIGPKTAQALRRHGIEPDFVPARFISEDVAAGLLERTSPSDRVLLFRAQAARDVLPERLREQQRHVDVVAAYKTTLVRKDDFDAKLAAADVVTFTSASTVHGFAAAAGDGMLAAVRGKTIACIGPVTASAAREAGLQVDLVADEFTVEGLLETLERSPA
jgi:uroporphyrinogen III methyltransferase / synthase